MINIYPTTFDNKDAIIEYLDKYNEGKDKDSQVVYTDLADTIMSMTDGIMTGITVVLIAFAGISRGAFYMYFQNKEDIFVYIISGYAGELAFNVVKGTNKEKNNITTTPLLDANSNGFGIISSLMNPFNILTIWYTLSSFLIKKQNTLVKN